MQRAGPQGTSSTGTVLVRRGQPRKEAGAMHQKLNVNRGDEEREYRHECKKRMGGIGRVCSSAH